jgi:hypothetical protein
VTGAGCYDFDGGIFMRSTLIALSLAPVQAIRGMLIAPAFAWAGFAMETTAIARYSGFFRQPLFFYISYERE